MTAETELSAEATIANVGVGRSMVLGDPWPVPWSSCIPDWLGETEIELPRDFPLARWDLLGILASNDAKHVALTPWWELALESVLRHARRSQRTLFFSSATPYADRLRHACERFRLPYLVLCRVSAKGLESDSKMAILRCVGNPLPNRMGVMDTKLEDRAIAILSHQLFGLHVRPRGRIARLIQARLAEPSMMPGATMVAIKDRPDRSPTRREAPVAWQLSDRGAVLWLYRNRSEGLRSDAGDWNLGLGCDSRGMPSTWMPYGRATTQLLQSEEFLMHFTRGRQGAWPDQSQDELFDEAIRMEWQASKDPLQSLHRILSCQRLIASAFLRRGNIRTVCFTAQSIQTMLDRRRFQAHIGRWDWEPYGIAIRKEWLASRGVRPVQYLHPRDVHRLSAQEQAFTQPLWKDDRHRDWSIEREWRVQDDIRLCQIPADQAFVFVNRRSEASVLSSLSRWPIVFVSS